jgi:hypothetical protein
MTLGAGSWTSSSQLALSPDACHTTSIDPQQCLDDL